MKIYTLGLIFIFNLSVSKAHKVSLLDSLLDGTRACVRPCVRPHFKTQLSLESSGPIDFRFYLKHHWVGGKAALGFGPNRI